MIKEPFDMLPILDPQTHSTFKTMSHMAAGSTETQHQQFTLQYLELNYKVDVH